MPKRSETPLEEREYGLFYLILAGILALTTFWAILDMLSFQSPWQKYQKKLNQMEYQNVEVQLNQAREKFNAQNAKQLIELKKQYERAETDQEGQAYEDLLNDLKQADVNIAEAMQKYRIAKSEYDALGYELTQAEHAADNLKAQKLRANVDALNKDVALLKLNWDNSVIHNKDLKARLDRYSVRTDSIQRQIDDLVAPIEKIEAKLELIDDRKIAIQQIVLPNFVRGNFESFLDQVDRCTSCHANTDKVGYDDYQRPFQTHPNREFFLKTHPINRFGCTPCHEGQGTALNVHDGHGYDNYSEHPLLKDEFIETGCNKCHSNELYVEHAPSLSKAKQMVLESGCYGCHDIPGYDVARKLAPPLKDILSKTKPAFIAKWVSNTKAFRQYSRMPNPELNNEEALAVTAYLNYVRKDSKYRLPRVKAGGSVNSGRVLIERFGCKGCHVITERDRQHLQSDVTYDLAPDLSKIGSKVNRNWLYAWIRNPKQYNPNTTMPDLRLTNAEVRNITTYLMTNKESESSGNPVKDADLESEELIAEGKTIIRNFGCHGCHEIPGMENEGKVSVSLDEFGAKTPEKLFFGDALANADVTEESWEAWTEGKLMNSRVYATEAVIQRMPNYAFSADDAQTLILLLKSLDGREISTDYLPDSDRLDEAKEKGRRLVSQYNCTQCHIIEGRGGFIRSIIAETIKNEGKPAEDLISFAPPDLIGEGRKVQPKWLFDFLKKPTIRIRPWLTIRMPTYNFKTDEINQLVEYFLALEGISGPFKESSVVLTRTEINAAVRLISRRFLNCYSCHQVGKKKPKGPPSLWAPDFLLIPDRLYPAWIYDWIANPQAILPGTKMPAFYPKAAPSNIMNGVQSKQIEALTDYLMRIRSFEKD